ncbi:hypothetical protein [Streptosporangium vulgare]|uniref:hypothetical protein n=1 Tax=Streptosporangium vulgare TaxID=46190 RepID=UPI0031E03C3A
MRQRSRGLTQLASGRGRDPGLQTYLAQGPKETQGPDDPQGAHPPEAAGSSTPTQRGFIKAEMRLFDELVETGSIVLRPPGGQGPASRVKDYVMRDGLDVAEFTLHV